MTDILSGLQYYNNAISLLLIDGRPDYVIASLLTVSKYQILVSWFIFNSPNSDPDLIQFEVCKYVTTLIMFTFITVH